MPQDAIFRSGNPVMADYTHGTTNTSEGTVIVLGSVTANTAGTGAIAVVAHRPQTNAVLGAVAVGGGVYNMVNLNNAATGAKVYWDITNNTRKVTTVSTNNAVMGWIVSGGGGGANTTCQVKHEPWHNAN
jgi:coenzyme F420-reducing hydrogenase gamma subunit